MNLLVVIIAFLACSVLIVPRKLPSWSSHSPNVIAASPVQLAADPCWFLTSKGFDTVAPEVVRKRQDREDKGYPTEISLTDAVNIFNEEQKCYPSFSQLSPLTPDEIVAASLSSPDYTTEINWEKQKAHVNEIIVKRTLPVGSLLVSESGPCTTYSSLGTGEICTKGQAIYLFWDLDKTSRMSGKISPQNVLLIRKVFSGFERR